MVNKFLNTNYILLQVGTVTPVEDYLALVNSKDVDKFDEGKLKVIQVYLLDNISHA